MATTSASIDEAAAIKRNAVHQTRLQLELKQLEKDRTTRLRELSHDAQSFVKRLEFINSRSKSRTSLPTLTRRAASAPPAIGFDVVDRGLLSTVIETRDEVDLELVKKVNDFSPFRKTRERRNDQSSCYCNRNTNNITGIGNKQARASPFSPEIQASVRNKDCFSDYAINRQTKQAFGRVKDVHERSQESLCSRMHHYDPSAEENLRMKMSSQDGNREERELISMLAHNPSQLNCKANKDNSKIAVCDRNDDIILQNSMEGRMLLSHRKLTTQSEKKVRFHVRELSAKPERCNNH